MDANEYKQKLIDKWELTGLLKNLETHKEKLECAILLERCANFLLSNKDNGKFSKEINKLLIPCVIRVYYASMNYDINIQSLSEILYGYICEFKDIIDSHFTVEMDICFLTARDYCERFLNNDKD